MLSDSASTVAGALLGTSTVTTYVESAAGVKAGGRTGMVSLVVGIGFLGMLILCTISDKLAKRNRCGSSYIYIYFICSEI